MFKKALNFTSLGLALTFLFGFIGELQRFHGFLFIDLFIPFFAVA